MHVPQTALSPSASHPLEYRYQKSPEKKVTAARTPHVDPMTHHKDSRSFQVLLHRCRHAIRQIFLAGGIGNVRDAEGIQVRQDRATSADPNTLDHSFNTVRSVHSLPSKSLTCARQTSRTISGQRSVIAIARRRRSNT